ncbi:MAG: 4-alpha-glucanotransferase [Actinobacteria bacterium]|nr:4-alpha-glucanotransferase [Actinomycetota bacterium]
MTHPAATTSAWAAAWGVTSGYEDVDHQWHDAPPETVAAVLEAMGADGPQPPGMGDDNPVWVVRTGDRVRAEGPWTLTLEDGGELTGEEVLPADVPLGYHHLVLHGGDRSVRLIVSPGRCHLPAGLHEWGFALQLYALRSGHSWGLGDLADLRTFASRARQLGAGFLLINPLHAALPGLPQQASPYFPSSRCFHNPLYLRVDDAELRDDGHSLNSTRRIHRDAAYELKLEALEAQWATFTSDQSFDAFVADGGSTLQGYGTFCALAELYGRPWQRWPSAVRHPSGPGIAEFAADFGERIRFHQWVQWLLDQQLGEASSVVPLMNDLAIGVDPAGADAWMWQDVFSLGMRVGAPPDEFNTDGQDWGLPPFDPWRLRMACFDPFIQTVRSGLRGGGGLRVDHVMGLFRLFWIPPGRGPDEGVYVRYPWQELLDILALESVRAGAFAVGEDLGTVEPEMREELARRNVLSTRVLWFEEDPPPTWPRQSLAAVTTHDLPTVAGVWTGIDSPDPMRARLVARTGLDVDAPVSAAVAAAYEAVARAPSMLVAASLDDVLEVRERPNHPGDDDRPNWSLALPMPLEAVVSDARVERVAKELGDR